MTAADDLTPLLVDVGALTPHGRCNAVYVGFEPSATQAAALTDYSARFKVRQTQVHCINTVNHCYCWTAFFLLLHFIVSLDLWASSSDSTLAVLLRLVFVVFVFRLFCLFTYFSIRSFDAGGARVLLVPVSRSASCTSPSRTPTKTWSSGPSSVSRLTTRTRSSSPLSYSSTVRCISPQESMYGVSR